MADGRDLTPREIATERGYTVAIVAESDFHTLEGWVRPGEDFDGTFPMITDDGDRLSVNGWLFIITVDAPNERL